jgi:DNA-binding response OmpR family regulator
VFRACIDMTVSATDNPLVPIGKSLTNPVLLLVVEDEPAILMMAEDVLQEAGFEVILAAKGDEALTTLDATENSPAGLVTDIRLGSGINGWEVARHAREKHPEIAVVYMTADSAADWAAYGVPKSVLVQKPFAGAQLVTAMANLLNDQAGNVTSG